MTNADGRARGEGGRTQKRKTWLSGQVRAEKVLADAVTIDGRKNECSKSHNVIRSCLSTYKNFGMHNLTMTGDTAMTLTHCFDRVDDVLGL